MIIVHWNEPSDQTVEKVRIKRGVAKWSEFFFVEEISAFNPNQTWRTQYQDADGEEGNWYKISFVNTTGNESTESDPVVGQRNGHTSFIIQIGNKNIQDFDSSDDNVWPQYPLRGYHRYTPKDVLFTGEASPYSKTPTDPGLIIFKRLAQREEMLLRATGEWVTLYRRKWEGEMCEDYDSRRGQSRHRCKICYGTGFLGGYNLYLNPYSSPEYQYMKGTQIVYPDEYTSEVIPVTIKWNPPKLADTVSVKIKRSYDPNGTFNVIDIVDAVDGYGDWTLSYTDSEGTRAHWYKVSFVNAIGQESQDSELIRYEPMFDREDGQSTPTHKILIRVGPTVDDISLKQQGMMQEYSAQCWSMPVPALRDRDFIIRYDENGEETWRHEILSVTRNVGMFMGEDNTNYLAQHFALRRLEKTDPLYYVGVEEETFPIQEPQPVFPIDFEEGYGDGYGPFDAYGDLIIATPNVEYETYYDTGYQDGWRNFVSNDGYDMNRNAPLATRVNAYKGYTQGYNIGYSDAYKRFGQPQS